MSEFLKCPNTMFGIHYRWSQEDIIPVIIKECDRLSVPLYYPHREAKLAMVYGGGLSPYKLHPVTIYGPCWHITEDTIANSVKWLKETEPQRFAEKEERIINRDKLLTIVTLNSYSRTSETSEPEFFAEMEKRGMLIFDVVKICTDALQVSVIQDQRLSDLAYELKTAKTNKRIAEAASLTV